MPIYGKNSGEWDEIVQLYANQKGVWVQVYEKYAIVRFVNYPYKIPTMKGWEYRFDEDTSWTTVTYDGMELNTLGYTFTGYVRVKSPLVLSNYYNEMQYGIRSDGTSLSAGRSHLMSAYHRWSGKGYVCGGVQGSTGVSTVDVYESGNRTSGTALSVGRYEGSAFVLSNNGTHICGGFTGSSYSNTVDKYDHYGNRTSGTALSVARSRSTSFLINENLGHVCGGLVSGSECSSAVDRYDDSGNRTTLTSLTTPVCYATAVGNPGTSVGYVVGGQTSSGTATNKVEKYDYSGTKTTLTCNPGARRCATGFTFNYKGYIFGGTASGTSATSVTYNNTASIIDLNGNLTTITLTFGAIHPTSFVLSDRAYVCGGKNDSGAVSTINMIDFNNNVTVGDPLSVGRYNTASFADTHSNDNAYVCGGTDGSSTRGIVDVYSRKRIAHLPIIGGSTYTLTRYDNNNTITGTPSESETLHIDTMVTGTINYEKGTI